MLGNAPVPPTTPDAGFHPQKITSGGRQCNRRRTHTIIDGACNNWRCRRNAGGRHAATQRRCTQSPLRNRINSPVIKCSSRQSRLDGRSCVRSFASRMCNSFHRSIDRSRNRIRSRKRPTSLESSDELVTEVNTQARGRQRGTGGVNEWVLPLIGFEVMLASVVELTLVPVLLTDKYSPDPVPVAAIPIEADGVVVPPESCL